MWLPNRSELCKYRRWLEAGNVGFKKELYYLCSGNKGADHLHSYYEADLCLCVRICKHVVCSLMIGFK